MVTFRCNMRCHYCDYWRRNSEELSLSEIFRMLEESAEIGIPSYTATGGEPLLRKDISEILKFASDLGFYVILFTNGLLLGERKVEADRIFISLDTLSREKFVRITGIDALPELISTLRRASENHEICLNTVIHEENLDEIEALVRFADELGVGISFEPVSTYFHGCPSLSREALRMSAEKLLRLKKEYECILNSKRYLEMILRGERFDCKPHFLLRVNPDGSVISPCYEIEHVGAGSIKDGIKNILRGERYLEGLERAKNCRGCYLSCYAETSMALSLRGLLSSLPTVLRLL
ncbi:MAG: hypothetical protein PWR13_1233 [Archaeoglobi archaeon]|nr:hypothetical protein [Archaeoglobi archaeon]MDK2782205.1 hypothetical protein [Archaeoglobi archaeon]